MKLKQNTVERNILRGKQITDTVKQWDHKSKPRTITRTRDGQIRISKTFPFLEKEDVETSKQVAHGLLLSGGALAYVLLIIWLVESAIRGWNNF